MSTLKKRFSWIVVIAMVAVVILPGLTRAQQEKAPPAGPNPDQPVASDIFAHIPAGVAAFMVSPNVNEALASIDSFMAATGLDKTEGLEAGSLLPLLAGQIGLGKGYNPNGGVAIIFPNPKALRMDPADQDPSRSVLLLAGKSAEEIFPKFVTKDENGKKQLMFPAGAVFSKKVGDYVAISESKKSLATMGKGKSIAATLAKEDLKTLREGNASFFYNVKVLTPELKTAIKTYETQMATREANGDRPMMAGLPEVFASYMEHVEQIDTMVLSARYAKQGLTLHVAATYIPTSKVGMMLAKMTASRRPLVSRLPNLPYVVAYGGKVPAKYGESVSGLMHDLFSVLLKAGNMAMPLEFQNSVTKLSAALGDEFVGMQIVGGGGKTKGVFGTAMVIQCHSATNTKALLKEKTNLVTGLFQGIIPEEKGLKTTKVQYTKSVEIVGGIQLDSMDITSEPFTNLKPDERKVMAQVLGEDKLRILIAEVDPKTLVLSFGGGTEMMGQAIQAAQRGGTISSDPSVLAVQKLLPKRRVSEMYLSLNNLISVAETGTVKMGEKPDMPPEFRLKNTLPIAMASTVSGMRNAAVLFVPAGMIDDITRLIKAQDRRDAESSENTDEMDAKIERIVEEPRAVPIQIDP